MKIKNKVYTYWHQLISITMILSLLWSTISLPYMYKSHQLAIKNQSTSFPGNNNKEQPSNPFSNSNEEKTPAGSENIFSEEYTQHTAIFFDAKTLSLRHKSDFCISVYKNFNGELICPPPKA